MATSAAGPVLIVGSGLIGRSWAMLFASGGFRVKLFDIEQQQITNALENIRKDMKLLEQSSSLKGSLSAEQQLFLITGCSNIQEAVEGAIHIQEGIVSPSDLDLVVSHGLGLRYAFIGPLETMHLNAEGMLSYCDRYGESMKHVLKTFGPIPEFSGATVEKVHQAMCVKVPDDPEHLAARRQWRDQCLMRLAKLKSQMPSQ
uniref:Crystallin lambda 1 n=1 Tax=Myotis myotis TaxID=51298 RepID=A0A7J7Z1H0_MYOMY|nr:crystallin lambda 1 [Myotis myotis]